ncbi:MAG: protease complex subunit PrcB family protein [Elusimicrobiota bacterium]|nr:MAG: protease complex subunit PrcB family protein [Elusimicrobiota bacterium]
MKIPLALLLFAQTALAADVPYEVVKMPLQRAKAGAVNIKAASRWNALWSADEVKACGHAVPMPAPPAIDFNKHEIVGIFLGEGGSSRKDPVVVSVKDSATELVVFYRADKPPKGTVSVARGVVTCPQVVIKIARTAKRVRVARAP